MRLKQLFREWQDGNKPRPQTALEYEAAVNDSIDFAGDIAVSTIDPDLLYDYRDEASKLPCMVHSKCVTRVDKLEAGGRGARIQRRPDGKSVDTVDDRRKKRACQ